MTLLTAQTAVATALDTIAAIKKVDAETQAGFRAMLDATESQLLTDLNRVKGIVAEAMAYLRQELDKQTAEKAAVIDAAIGGEEEARKA